MDMGAVCIGMQEYSLYKRWLTDATDLLEGEAGYHTHAVALYVLL